MFSVAKYNGSKLLSGAYVLLLCYSKLKIFSSGYTIDRKRKIQVLQFSFSDY